jgi:hypothetical protein
MNLFSLTEAKKIVKFLSDHFQVPEPLVKFTRYRSGRFIRSWYYKYNNEIHLSRLANIYSVLHEFSHALNWSKNKKTGHKKEFCNCLLDVVDYYYAGNISRYTWKWEYSSIQKFYIKIRKSNTIRRKTMETQFKIEEGIQKPARASEFPLNKIQIKGALTVKVTEGETLAKVAAKVRNVVAIFKKKNPEYKLSVHIFKEANKVQVYRNE